MQLCHMPLACMRQPSINIVNLWFLLWFPRMVSPPPRARETHYYISAENIARLNLAAKYCTNTGQWTLSRHDFNTILNTPSSKRLHFHRRFTEWRFASWIQRRKKNHCLFPTKNIEWRTDHEWDETAHKY